VVVKHREPDDPIDGEHPVTDVLTATRPVNGERDTPAPRPPTSPSVSTSSPASWSSSPLSA
jgi:hypothetical protein